MDEVVHCRKRTGLESRKCTKSVEISGDGDSFVTSAESFESTDTVYSLNVSDYQM